jgi:NAD(P) transhydrogenase subunit beta
MELNILIICYLIGSVTFIIGLKMLSHPESARQGNLIAAAGMAVSILGTIFLYEEEGLKLGNYSWIFSALIIGTVLGTIAAKRVKMTAMPEMVSLFNGMGGACAALISIVEFDHLSHIVQSGATADRGILLIIFAGLIIGTVSFSGSMVAWGKLNGKIKDFSFKGQHIVNLVIFGVIIALSAYLIISLDTAASTLFYVVFALSIVYGLFFVFPIGGADMPVVISLLNSFTGVAAACGGFLYDNKAMLTGGILVGSAGTLLTIVMCKAMNRPLSNVIFGAFGGGSDTAASGAAIGGSVKDISISDLAVLMNYSRKVVIVPGYGLAVAQAQHVIHEIELLLESRGVEVKYAIHPVAGRMPGHMNVLLAESSVDYDKLVEMEEINPEFPTTDVVLIVGANDVVNPAAKTDPSSPIYGMPILEVNQAAHVVVNKRSMNAGYAGIDNPLFYDPKTSMLFGDAKTALTGLANELKNL